jgi:3-hydroxybutyryl-CoA dehydrogenase
VKAEIRAVGVVGAGTMGAGIAQVAALAGYETYLHDSSEEALERGLSQIATGLRKGVERGRWSAEDATAARTQVHAAPSLEALSSCDLVIEAAPEDLGLKRELFAQLSALCGPETILATNTSSLPVTALASAAARPENVVGMHFFNPAPLMELLEVVAGSESSQEAVEAARVAGQRMRKRVIVARDGPGFLANRCGRPFGMEALRLLQQGVADHATIDRIVRMGGGFRMGPFELMDLVGIDVGFEVSKSFWEQSFHEPRWQPSMIQARMVQAGRFGRKAGRGYYDYRDGEGRAHREEDPRPPVPGGGGRVVVEGEGRLAEELRELAGRVGYEVGTLEKFPNLDVEIVVDAIAGRSPSDSVLVIESGSVAHCILCVDGSLADLDAAGNAVGFHALPPLQESSLVELTQSSQTPDASAERAELFFRSLGKHVEWVEDAPGLVLGRIVCQLVNEAAFALMEEIGSVEGVDTALRYGFNYPRGPLEWADTIELDQVLSTLDALYEELREERYRAAPLLRRMVAEGKLGRSMGEGFYAY